VKPPKALVLLGHAQRAEGQRQKVKQVRGVEEAYSTPATPLHQLAAQLPATRT
jgi:hypothetical protein